MENNKNFIKGGLPLGTDDFVNKDKARESKNKLLAALDNINRIHDEKMNSVVDNSNNIDINETISMLNNEVQNTTNYQDFNNTYISAQDFNTTYQSQFENPNNNQPLFNNPNPVDIYNQPQSAYIPMDDYQNNINNNEFESFDMDENPINIDNPVDFNESQPMETSELEQPQFEQGEPMYVMDDSEVGKKGKNKKKIIKSNISKEEVKNGKGVAWLAYILFFIPLLLNGKNAFVRHHANEGLCLNIIDIIGAGLIIAGLKVAIEGKWAQLGLTLAMVVGIVLIALTTVTKIASMFMVFMGRETRNPFLRVKIIK